MQTLKKPITTKTSYTDNHLRRITNSRKLGKIMKGHRLDKHTASAYLDSLKRYRKILNDAKSYKS